MPPPPQIGGSTWLLYPQVPPSSSSVKCLPRKPEQLPDLKGAVHKPAYASGVSLCAIIIARILVPISLWSIMTS